MDTSRPIVILTTFYKPFISGAELCVQEMAERRGDRQVVVIAGLRDRSLPRLENDNGVMIIRVGVGHLWDKFLFPFLCVIPVLKLKPHIVHAVMESHAAMGLALIKWLRPKIRAVLTLQSGNLDEDPKLTKWPMSWIWKKIHTVPDEVTAISQFLADRAIKIRGGGKVEVIPNGVDLNLVKGLPEQKVSNRIVCIARYSKEKGVDTLIKAFALVLKQIPEAEMYLVGYGDEQSYLEQLAKDQGCAERIVFTGKKDHEGAMRVLRTGSVFSLLSRGEGQGIVLLEAAAAGLPTVATRVGGIPEAMIDGKTGYLVERDDYQAAANKLIELLKNPQLADQMGQEGQTFVQQFDWASCISNYHVLWNKLDKQKKIVFATGIYPPDIGGPAGYVKRLGSKLREKGNEISIVAYGDVTETKTSENVMRIKRGSRLKLLNFFWAVYKTAKGADVVYAQSPISDGAPAWLAARLRGAKFIIKTVGDYAWEQYMDLPHTGNPESLEEFLTHRHSGKIRILEAWERFIGKRADLVITPSQYFGEKALSAWGIHKDRIRIVQNSIEAVLTAPRQQLRLDLGVADKKVIFTAGRSIALKRVDFLLTLMKDLPDFTLVIGGDGPFLEAWKKLAIDLGVDSQITWLGRLDRQGMENWYCAADVFVLPSAHETFPHVLIEAAATGLPCIASNKGGSPEVARKFPDLVTILPMDDRQAWIDAISNLKPRQEPRLPETFTLDFMVNKTEEVLAE